MEEQIKTETQEQEPVIKVMLEKPPKKRKKKNLGVIAGILSIFFGVLIFFMDTGSLENPEYYGGDAYTGIQQAAAQTADNVKALSDICRCGFASVLIVAGFAMIAFFAANRSKRNLG